MSKQFDWQEYPEQLNEQEKEVFDDIRLLARSIPEYICLIFDGTSVINIEVNVTQISNKMWDIFDTFNSNPKALSINFVRVIDKCEGERYV